MRESRGLEQPRPFLSPGPCRQARQTGDGDREQGDRHRLRGHHAHRHPGRESALGDLIADAQRTYAGTQIAFMNPGGIRADIQSGQVTYGELFTVQPFDNQVVKMELTGDQINRLLEQQFEVNRILQLSGFNYTYNASNPAGERITSVTINGAPLDRNATCTVAANGFIATGGDGFTVFGEAGATQQTLGSDLDALEAYIGSQQQIGIPADFGQRITKRG